MWWNVRFEAGEGEEEAGQYAGKGKSFYDDSKNEIERQMQANRAEFADDGPESRALFEG